MKIISTKMVIGLLYIVKYSGMFASVRMELPMITLIAMLFNFQPVPEPASILLLLAGAGALLLARKNKR